MAPTYWIGDEEVNGIIIGPVTFAYRFYTETDPKEPITGFEYFSNDDEAIAWFKENYPEHFKAGAEMRVWN
jgi:hypothetical protein